MNQVKEMKSLDEDERYEILKPLREAGLWLMDLTTYLRQPLDISNEDFFDATIMTLMSMFGYIEKSLHEAIAALVNAPLQKNAGELIGQMREISLKFTEFKEQVPGQAQELRNQILNSGEETPLTLRDIVQSAQVQRTFQLHGEQENVGQGASDVIRVTEGDKVFYFKENEAIKNIRESLWDVLPLLGEVHLNQAVAEFLSRTKEDTPENLEQLKTFYKMVNFLSARGTVNEDMLEYIQQLLPGIDVLQLAQEHADQWRAFAKEVGKKYVTIQSASAKELLLDEGANMTARNYASERVAELLGAKGLIVRNQIAIVREEDGFEKKGFIMEQAQGIPVHQLDREARDKGYEVHMTGDAQKQLLNLQILDNIIGQTDRHTGNYFVDYDVDAENHTFLVKKVTGIDNDFAFGKSLMVGGGNTTSILKEDGTYQYSMIDPEMYENIMTLSPELLETNLENVIERKYIDALKTRFETVREALRKAKEDAEQNGRDFFRKQGGWGEESEQLWMHEAANSYLRRVKRW